MSDDREKFIKRFNSDLEGDVNRTMSTSRWLLENGLIDASIQENLVCYGYLASEDVMDFEVSFDIKKKMIYYRFFLDKDGLKRYSKYMKLVRKNPKSIIGKWIKLRRLRKLVPDGGHKISIESNIKRFLEAFLPDFNVTIELYDIDEEENVSVFVEKDNEETKEVSNSNQEIDNGDQTKTSDQDVTESSRVAKVEPDSNSDGS